MNRALTAVAFTLQLAPLAHAQEPLAPDEIRAIAAEVMADAETRSSLVGQSAGYDGGFFIAGDDAAFRLSVGGLLQFRYQYNHREDADDKAGFYNARSRMWFQGKVFEKVDYYIRAQFSGSKPVGFAEEERVNGIFEVDRAWVGFELAKGWSLRIGEQGSEFSRETDLSPQNQLCVNSSPTDSVFSLGGYQGARLAYQGEDLRAFFTFSEGARNINSDFGDPRNAQFALTFKGDWKIAGEWSQFSDFTSPPGSDTAVMLGAGVHWENGAQVGDPAENLALLGAIFEVSVEGDGWSLYGAFNYFNNTFRSPDDDLLHDFGFVVQGSVYLTDSIEPFLRFDAVLPDAHRENLNQDFMTLTAGFNWYLMPRSNAAKFSFDVLYMFDEQATSLVSPSSNVGVLASEDDDQITARAQFTFVF